MLQVRFNQTQSNTNRITAYGPEIKCTRCNYFATNQRRYNNVLYAIRIAPQLWLSTPCPVQRATPPSYHLFLFTHLPFHSLWSCPTSGCICLGSPASLTRVSAVVQATLKYTHVVLVLVLMWMSPLVAGPEGSTGDSVVE